MAYQPKSYRKFIAGAAAVAVVAPVVAPVASLAAVNFSDVEGQYVDAVEFLVSKGIQGKPMVLSELMKISLVKMQQFSLLKL